MVGDDVLGSVGESSDEVQGVPVLHPFMSLSHSHSCYFSPLFRPLFLFLFLFLFPFFFLFLFLFPTVFGASIHRDVCRVLPAI
jgi:hypothetical protein